MVELKDAIEGLHSLPQQSAALVLSDLPSGETRAEFDRAPDLTRLWPAVWRVLAADGAAVFMASSLRFAASIVASQPNAFRYDLVWSKSLATGHLNARTRPLRAHEFVLVFWRNPGCFTPQMLSGATPIHAARAAARHGENYNPRTAVTESRKGATDRYPTSVLEFGSVGTTAPERIHPQQKPVALLRWLIRSYSHPGDLIVDPYAGSGSTGVAAQAEGRRFVGFDSSPRFGATL
jgi:DNA modification methylase